MSDNSKVSAEPSKVDYRTDGNRNVSTEVKVSADLIRRSDAVGAIDR